MCTWQDALGKVGSDAASYSLPCTWIAARYQAQLASVAAIGTRLLLVRGRQVRQAVIFRRALQILQLLLGLLFRGVGLLGLCLRRVELA